MPRNRHRSPNQLPVAEKSQIEKAEAVKRELQAGGLQVAEVQFWKNNKLSDAIRKLIKPYAAEANTYDSYYSLVGFASVAWNASLVEEPTRSEVLDDFIKKSLKRGAPREARDGIREFIVGLLQRKLKLFPKDTRFIASFELEDQGDDFYLSVASVMPADEK
jgi:hypothetical protein